jgi:hypothetical protein
MSPIEFKYHGVTFHIAPVSVSGTAQPYSHWTNATRGTTVHTDGTGSYRTSVRMWQGVRLNDRLRKRILRAARKARPYEVLPDDAPILFALEVGFDYRHLGYVEHEDKPTTEKFTRPELWLSLGLGQPTSYWKPYNSPERSGLQRVLDKHTFGMGMESKLDDVWEKLEVEGGLLHFDSDEEYLSDLLERALRALHEPPAKARAFPTNFQQDVIEAWRPSDVDVSEYDWIIDDTLETAAALGLRASRSDVHWDTYPASGAANFESMTLLDVMRCALSDKADARMADGPDIAKTIAQYRKDLLTPKNMLLMAVPLYADAFANVYVTFKAEPLYADAFRARQVVSWEAAYDFDETLEAHDPERAKNAEVEAVIEEIADDVKDAVETLLDGMASRCDEHYNYITSDEGVWESAEGCGDFDDVFTRHIVRS